MSRRVPPYRKPSADVVKAEEWEILVDGGRMDLPDALPDWDYQMDLKLRRSVRVDLDLLRIGTGLSETDPLTLAVVWTATGSSLRAPALRVRLTGAGTRTVEVVADLKGANLGGLLMVDTVLVLAQSTMDGWPAAPSRAGSMLWSDRRSVRLQGDAPQFPIAVIDFSKTQFPENAAWHVQLTGNLETATMGALLLLVNERKADVVAAFQNAATPKPIDRIVLSAVYADVARIMIEHALRNPDFETGMDFPDESLGATLKNLVHTLFPNVSIENLRRRFEQTPNLFASELQNAVRIFEV